MSKLTKISIHEAKKLLAASGLKIKASYCHEDYLLTSVSMPYDVKDKLDRIKHRFGIPRSSMITMLINMIDENTLEMINLEVKNNEK